MLLLLSFNVTDLISIQEKTTYHLTTIKAEPAEENTNKGTESSQFSVLSVKALKQEKTELEVGRKRSNDEDKPTVEEPPPKKGTVSSIVEQGVFQNNKLLPIPDRKQKAVKRVPYGIRRKATVLNCK